MAVGRTDHRARTGISSRSSRLEHSSLTATHTGSNNNSICRPSLSRHTFLLHSTHIRVPDYLFATHDIQNQLYNAACRTPSIMAALNLRLDEPGDDHLQDEMFPILSDALEPGSGITLESAARKISDLLPDGDPHSQEASTFCDLCIQIAMQIPYTHAKMADLVAFVQLVLDLASDKNVSAKRAISPRNKVYQVADAGVAGGRKEPFSTVLCDGTTCGGSGRL